MTKMKKTLKPFQIEGAKFLKERYHALLADEMGLGKTVTALAAAEAVGSVKALIVCPASVRTGWAQEISECGMTHSRFHIISYNQAVNGAGLDRASWDVLVLDECFPANTAIETVKGPKRIEDVRCGEFVLSCSLSGSVLEYKRVVRTIHKRRRHLIVCIAHQSGALVCTANHKVWTEERGYVQAGEINDGESVRVLWEDVHDPAQRGRDGKILLQKPREYLGQHPTGDAGISESEILKTSGIKTVHELWEDVRDNAARFRESVTAILHSFLLGDLEKLSTGNARALSENEIDKSYADTRGEKSSLFGPHETTQSHVQSHLEREGQAEIGGENFSVAGREWGAHEAPDYAGRCAGLGDGVRHTDSRGGGAFPVSSDLLQSGPRKSGVKDSGRGGRANSQDEEMEVLGRAQDRCFKLSRVESVKVLERRDIERLGLCCEHGEQVYNLEVEDNHNYFASGVLVSNCHFLKNPESQRTQAIFGNGTGIARRAQRIWGLSGTPVLNRPRELYPILKTLHSKGIAPYDTWERFTQRYCGAFFDGYSINTKGASHIEELRGRLSGFMLRREKKDVLKDLPPRIISHPPVELSTSELSPILELEEEIGNREAYLSPTHEDYAQLGDMARLLKVTGVAKIPAVSAFISDLLETENKVVIFARHRDVISGLAEALKKFSPVTYVGGMSDDQKKNVVSKFVRDSECKVFIGQIQAAGTGINGLQTVCHNVCFAELSWVPGEMSQAIDRCHRIGQGSDVVNVYMPHVPGTLESAMLQVQLGKGKVIEALVGSRNDDLEGLV